MSNSDNNRKKSIFRQIIVSVIIALLVGGTAPWWWDEFFSAQNENGSDQQEQFNEGASLSEDASSEKDIERNNNTRSEEQSDTNSEAKSASGCVVTISNELVSLMSQPDEFSTEISSVEPGEYETMNYKVVETGPGEQGWFKIQVEGREGWIKNDTWTIDSKTEECP